MSHLHRNQGDNTSIEHLSAGMTTGSRPSLARQQLDTFDNGNNIFNWQASAGANFENENAGIFQQLVRSCCDSLSYLSSQVDTGLGAKRDIRVLRRCHTTLQLWASGHKVWQGTLDATLDRSKSLRQTTMSTLNSLCKVLLHGLTKHFNLDYSDAVLVALRTNLSQTYEKTRWLLLQPGDCPSDSDSESDFDEPGDEHKQSGFSWMVEEIKMLIDCLTDLSGALEEPAVDLDDMDEPSVLEIEQRAAHGYHTELIKAKFPKARVDLVDRLGLTSWNRYQLLQKERAKNVNTPIEITDEKSQAATSKFHDSGLGTSVPSGYAESVVSFMTSLAGGKRVQIPALSADAKAGTSFECCACGREIRAQNETIWRQHLYNDLRPYTCFQADCAYNTVAFGDRKQWSSHLELDHAFGPDWKSIQCPLCHKDTENGKYAVLAHFSRHMEDIALIALPKDVESDDDSDRVSVSSKDTTATRSSWPQHPQFQVHDFVSLFFNRAGTQEKTYGVIHKSRFSDETGQFEYQLGETSNSALISHDTWFREGELRPEYRAEGNSSTKESHRINLDLDDSGTLFGNSTTDDHSPSLGMPKSSGEGDYSLPEVSGQSQWIELWSESEKNWTNALPREAFKSGTKENTAVDSHTLDTPVIISPTPMSQGHLLQPPSSGQSINPSAHLLRGKATIYDKSTGLGSSKSSASITPSDSVFQATPQPSGSQDAATPRPVSPNTPDPDMITAPLSQYTGSYVEETSPASGSRRKPRVKSEKRSQSMTIWWAERKARKREQDEKKATRAKPSTSRFNSELVVPRPNSPIASTSNQDLSLPRPASDLLSPSGQKQIESSHTTVDSQTEVAEGPLTRSRSKARMETSPPTKAHTSTTRAPLQVEDLEKPDTAQDQSSLPPSIPRARRLCLECRRRKMACDGTKPECNSCTRRGVACPGYGQARSIFGNLLSETTVGSKSSISVVKHKATQDKGEKHQRTQDDDVDTSTDGISRVKSRLHLDPGFMQAPRFNKHDVVMHVVIKSGQRTRRTGSIHQTRYDTASGQSQYQLKDILTGTLLDQGAWFRERDLRRA